MNLAVLFVVAVTLFLADTSVKLAVAEEDDDVDWGDGSDDQCESSQNCDSSECCLKKGGNKLCQLKADIGQRCSNSPTDEHEDYCPCKSPHRCKDMGEGLKICVAPGAKRK
ncbi:uncharacterized protein LOC142558153 [Dermacentor variabilis]|uniref:uncharacterized protein LOC142558153 n=1 Tax=Dermacentor variabilis TaxID=34621 RepID=UPI003F5B3568